MLKTTFLTAVIAFGAATVDAIAAGGTPEAKTARLTVGDRFPAISGEFLTGRKATLPDVAAGKVALVLMGFTYDSRFPVEKYGKALRDAYGGQPAFTFYEVPVIGGMGRMARWFIDSGMRKGTPKELHENVITVYGGVGRLKELFGFTKAAEKDAYLALIDQTGQVLWLQHGQWDPAAWDAMRAAIDAALTAGATASAPSPSAPESSRLF